MTLLEAPLADHLVLAKANEGRLHLFNPVAAWIWQARRAGLSDPEICTRMAEQFAIPVSRARSDLAGTLRGWRREGLLRTGGMEQRDAGGGSQLPSAVVVPNPPCSVRPMVLRLAEAVVGLAIDSPVIAAALSPILEPLRARSNAETPLMRIRLQGHPEQWELLRDGYLLAQGDALEDAIVQTVTQLVEIGCHARDRLMILHAAGLVYRRRGLLLVGQGGSGKTTLATALNAEGMELLGDDVIPVTQTGDLRGIGMSLCLKSGSWPSVSELRPEIDGCRTIARLEQRVRYLPPCGELPSTSVKPGWLLFPRYRPRCEPTIDCLSPVEAFRGVIEAEPLIADLDHQKLVALTRWVEGLPAYAVSYPDTRTGVDLVKRVTIEN